MRCRSLTLLVAPAASLRSAASLRRPAAIHALLDAGARDFVRWGSPTDGKHGELLHDFREQLFARCKRLDALHSRVTRRQQPNKPRPNGYSRTARQRYETTRTLKRKLARGRRRLHNWVEGAHYDAANFLLCRYDVVIMPKLETGRMAPKDSRVFNSDVARAMYTMSHGLFAERLASAAVRQGRWRLRRFGRARLAEPQNH